jgi:hypothetical protein
MQTKLSKEQYKILTQLTILWEEFPDERLGQLLENHVFVNGRRGDQTSVKLFYQEDKETLGKLYFSVLVAKNRSKHR